MIETQVGNSRDVADLLRSMSGVPSVDTITGVYDIIALVEAADMLGVANDVTSQIQRIPGVSRTITCVAV